MVEFNSLLVPTDFSPPAKAAFDYALKLASGEGPVVIVLHVIDPSLAHVAAACDLGSKDELIRRMRERAQRELANYLPAADSDVEVQTIVSEGPPFLEIVQKAAELLVDAVVMGKSGARGEAVKLLFGSTAERVLRGSTRPVLVLPVEPPRAESTGRGESQPAS